MSLADQLAPVCAAIARLLSPHAEVVVHDPRTDSIVGIWNPLSGRSVGDPSMLSELDNLDSVDDVYGPYPKSLTDGRALSSVSAVVRDTDGHADLLLCVNVDRTAFDTAARLLAGFATPVTGQPQTLFERDWTETVNEVVAAYVRAHGVPVERLTRDDRLALLVQLDEAGVFSHRRAVPVVARAFYLSRSTVYHLLAESRKDTRAH